MVDGLALFPGDLELARISPLAGGQHHPLGPIGRLGGRNLEDAGLLAAAGHRFTGLQFQLVVGDDLMPAAHQVFLGGPVKPELAFGGVAVGFCVDPFALGEVLDGIGDLFLFQQEVTQASLVCLQGSVQPGGASTHDQQIQQLGVVASDRPRQGGDVLHHLVALGHGGFDDRGAGQVADDEEARDVALVVLAQQGAFIGSASRMQHRDQSLLDFVGERDPIH